MAKMDIPVQVNIPVEEVIEYLKKGGTLVEVVRCRDCIHRFVDGENVRFNVCELNHNKVQADDWFCADGEVATVKNVDSKTSGDVK